MMKTLMLFVGLALPLWDGTEQTISNESLFPDSLIVEVQTADAAIGTPPTADRDSRRGPRKVDLDPDRLVEVLENLGEVQAYAIWAQARGGEA